MRKNIQQMNGILLDYEEFKYRIKLDEPKLEDIYHIMIICFYVMERNDVDWIQYAKENHVFRHFVKVSE